MTEKGSHVVRYLLSVDFEPEDVDRMSMLAERAREGKLSSDEEAATF